MRKSELFKRIRGVWKRTTSYPDNDKSVIDDTKKGQESFEYREIYCQ